MKKAGIEIHGRSVFLQGLLLMESTSLPPYFDSIKPLINRFHEKVRDHGLTPIQAALGFVIGLNEIDIAVCGVNNKIQLQEICDYLKPLSAEIFEEYGITNQEILNPSLWRS